MLQAGRIRILCRCWFGRPCAARVAAVIFFVFSRGCLLSQSHFGRIDGGAQTLLFEGHRAISSPIEPSKVDLLDYLKVHAFEEYGHERCRGGLRVRAAEFLRLGSFVFP